MDWAAHKMQVGKDRTRFELYQMDVTVGGVKFRLAVRRMHTNDHGYKRGRPFAMSITRKGDSMPEFYASGFRDAEQAKRVALAYVGTESNPCPNCVGGWRFERDGAGNLRDAPVPCESC